MPIERVELNILTLKKLATEILTGFTENILLIGGIEVLTGGEELKVAGDIWREEQINKLRAGISLKFPPKVISFKWRLDPLAINDGAIGEVPVVPIGFLGHVDGNGKKMTAGELEEVRKVARTVGAGTTERPIGDHNGTVIEHEGWVWVRGALAAALGLTALGLGTAFGIEYHNRRKRRR